ncbi:MAG: hypothetical protein E5W81_03640 [Mesorhizobium sp.]|uniref:hypothetical protein n=1 Tax=Mesorhizobium sp. TaxID=1871066 RepID=UPI000FE54B13|nr:hypothetical protein [Mesorhizobium sp.]RWD32156.1 MAG: hypothetical protein EOS34_21785 [Mesorhizobium sp.]RWQ47394.1 MAG: hypothetical protein EOS83_27580 [Mesorhizobium sp.]TIX46005.1 MAG: hypothetical protein E5V36_03400 [Mesorhizobium sp.]TKB97274.1 MAG: hypothetical protein E5W81_03640 [Mesorhizobium sp.]
MQHYIAGICARFGEHRKWIAGNRRFLEVKAEWEKQPFDQQYRDDNPVFRILEAAKPGLEQAKHPDRGANKTGAIACQRAGGGRGVPVDLPANRGF